jgi:hypothetical protein
MTLPLEAGSDSTREALALEVRALNKAKRHPSDSWRAVDGRQRCS